MSCDCVSKIGKDLSRKFTEQGRFDKPVKQVRLEGVTIVLKDDAVTTVTTSALKIDLEGWKNAETMQVTHKFCPFCGTGIEKGENR